MVAVLIRMKMAVLRNSMHGAYLGRLGWGSLFGLASVYFTFHFGLLGYGPALDESDKLAFIYGIWTLGWIFGPILFAGEDKTLLPENFRLLPVTPHRLATGLLGASLFGVPALISLLAFSSLIVYALRSGGIPSAIAAIPAVLLQLAFVVSLSRVVTSTLRKLVRSQASSLFSSMITGGIMAFFITGWLLLDLDTSGLANGIPTGFSMLLYAIPTNWGILAADAAGDGQWWLTIASLAGLAILIGLLKSVWARLLNKRLTTSSARAGVRGRSVARGIGSGLFTGPIGTVARKEWIAWRRDYTRSGFVYFAFFYSVFLCLYPAIAGYLAALPWAAAIFVVTVTGSTANLYGADGSALWITLVTPHAERFDVRGRQIAWLMIVAPTALALVIGMIGISGQGWALPLVLTLTIAALGGGAGLVVLNSVYRLEPMIDAHKRGDDMFDHPLGMWQFISVMLVLLILIAPPAALTITGVLLGLDWLQWVGTVVSTGFAILYFWWLGQLAVERLAAFGPELLHRMLHNGQESSSDSMTNTLIKPTVPAVVSGMTRSKIIQFVVCEILGVLALFPQGIVPLAIKLFGGSEQAWFLALYLPDPWQFPVIAFMICGGLLAVGYAAIVYFAHKAAVRKVEANG